MSLIFESWYCWPGRLRVPSRLSRAYSLLCFFFFFQTTAKKPFYLAEMGVSWGTQDLRSLLRHVGSLVAAQELSCSMWELEIQPGIELKTPALGAQSLSHWTTKSLEDFPGGTVDRNLPASAGNGDLIPGPGIFHMPRYK